MKIVLLTSVIAASILASPISPLTGNRDVAVATTKAQSRAGRICVNEGINCFWEHQAVEWSE